MLLEIKTNLKKKELQTGTKYISGTVNRMRNTWEAMHTQKAALWGKKATKLIQSSSSNHFTGLRIRYVILLPSIPPAHKQLQMLTDQPDEEVWSYGPVCLDSWCFLWRPVSAHEPGSPSLPPPGGQHPLQVAATATGELQRKSAFFVTGPHSLSIILTLLIMHWYSF